MQATANYLPQVKEQYEDYPYPLRDPENEKKTLLVPYLDAPDRLNHYCFGGRQHFAQGFRILIAGGGTGDSTIFMAEQYGALGAEIVHLDLSAASIDIARQRAKRRGIDKKITFINGSLLDLPALGLPAFDYINCVGVLHHLSDPIAGFQGLAGALKPNGVLAIMVYGQYGRQGIYPLQKTFQILAGDAPTQAEKLRLGRMLFNQLPRTNWYHFTGPAFQNETGNDPGFYDLLLHSQDRAYTVPELYSATSAAGLNHLSFQHHAVSGEYFYNPARLVPSAELLHQLAKRTLEERQSFTELLSGSMAKHEFYASRRAFQVPDPSDDEMVPVLSFAKHAMMRVLREASKTTAESFIVCEDPQLKLPMKLRVGAATHTLLQLVDSRRTIAELVTVTASRNNTAPEQVKEDWLRLWEDCQRDDILFLRHASVPPFDNIETLQQKMKKRMGY